MIYMVAAVAAALAAGADARKSEARILFSELQDLLHIFALFPPV